MSQSIRTSQVQQDSHKKKILKKKSHAETSDKIKSKEGASQSNSGQSLARKTQEDESPWWDPTPAQQEYHNTKEDTGVSEGDDERTAKEAPEAEIYGGKTNAKENVADREEFPPTREKGSAMTKMAKCDKAFMKALMKIAAAAGDNEQITSQLDNIMAEYTKLKTITLELSHENKYQEGRLKELEEKVKAPRTFADALKTGAEDGHPPTPVEERKRTSALIITSETLTAKKLESVVKRKIDPAKLGLTDAAIRPGRDGVVVTTTSKAALEKLKEAIQKDKETQDLQTKTPKPRKMEMKVVGIDPDTDLETLTHRIVSQNHLDCNEMDLELRRHWNGKNGITAIVAVSKKALTALGSRRALNINWNRCPIYDNIYISRCTKCASYGHNRSECSERSRCFNCGGEDHQGSICERMSKCPVCVENQCPVEESRHSMMSWKCPAYLSALEVEKRRLSLLID